MSISNGKATLAEVYECPLFEFKVKLMMSYNGYRRAEDKIKEKRPNFILEKRQNALDIRIYYGYKLFGFFPSITNISYFTLIYFRATNY